jgi:hypothetical protein
MPKGMKPTWQQFGTMTLMSVSQLIYHCCNFGWRTCAGPELSNTAHRFVVSHVLVCVQKADFLRGEENQGERVTLGIPFFTPFERSDSTLSRLGFCEV